MKFIRHAFHVLYSHTQNPDANLKLLLSRYLEKREPIEKEEITRTVYGVTRRQIALDHLIRLLTHDRFPSQRTIAVYLRIGCYLLVYSDSYPAHAVVNETVSAVAKGFKPLVNALLRRVAEKREAMHLTLSSHPDLSIRYSLHPLLIESLNRLSPRVEELLEYLDREPLFHLHPNPGRLSWDDAKTLLTARGVPYREIQELQVLEVKKVGGEIQELLRKGMIYAQNTASQLVSILAARFSRGRLFDVAAAPGSKSFTISRLSGRLLIMASDLRWSRLQLMKKNLEVLGAGPCIHLFTADAFSLPVKKKEGDFFLLDLPCSSVGTLRKNPDLKIKITPDRVRALAESQARILHSYFPLPRGGYLLYAVCSFLEEESERLISDLQGCFNADPVDFTSLLDENGFSYHRGHWGLYLLPSAHNNDLFYISLLRACS